MNRPSRFYVVDSSENTPLGHSVPAFGHIVRALQESDIEVGIMASRKFLEALERESATGAMMPDLSAVSFIESRRSFAENIKLLLAETDSKRPCQLVIVIPTLAQIDFDFLEQATQITSEDFDIVTIANLSSFVRRGDLNSSDDLLLKRAVALQFVTTIFYWDSLTVNELPFELQPKCRKLEEFHDHNLDYSLNVRHQLADVGFFGSSLSATRGLVEFVLLALLNPRLRFVAMGKHVVWRGGYLTHIGKRRWFVRKLLAILDAIVGWSASIIVNHLRNLKFEERYPQTQMELNEALLSVGGVFTAGHIHPYSSGIALQSIAVGNAVIWTKGNSAISDHLEKSGVGGRLNICNFLVPGLLSRSWHRLIRTEQSTPIVTWEQYRESLINGLNLNDQAKH